MTLQVVHSLQKTIWFLLSHYCFPLRTHSLYLSYVYVHTKRHHPRKPSHELKDHSELHCMFFVFYNQTSMCRKIICCEGDEIWDHLHVRTASWEWEEIHWGVGPKFALVFKKTRSQFSYFSNPVFIDKMNLNHMWPRGLDLDTVWKRKKYILPFYMLAQRSRTGKIICDFKIT